MTEGASDATISGANVDSDPLSVESSLHIGFTCLGDCQDLRKGITSEANSGYQLLQKRQLEPRWLEELHESPPSVFAFAYLGSSASNKRDQYFLEIYRVLAAPPMLACTLELNGTASPTLRARFDQLSRICRELDFELVVADPEP